MLEQIDIRKVIDEADKLPRKTKFGAIGISLTSLILVTFVRLLLDPLLGDRLPLAIYIIPVMVTAWYVGIRGGLIAIAISLFVGEFLFFNPKYSIGIQGVTGITLATLFVIVGIFLSVLSKFGNSYVKKIRELTVAEKRARVNSQNALEYRDKFLSFASHELKTPLTISIICLQMFQKKLKQQGSNKDLEKDIVLIMKQIDRIRVLTNRLLDVSNISGGMLKLNPSKFEISDCIKEAVEQFTILGVTHKIDISGSRKKIYVLADRDKILQVLINLITNAIQYSPNSKTVLISTASSDKQTQVSVKDFGLGIEKSEQTKIFKRFYKPKENSTFPGLGIGLYFSREIVNRHNGKIWVESKLKEGSTFKFTLPR